MDFKHDEIFRAHASGGTERERMGCYRFWRDIALEINDRQSASIERMFNLSGRLQRLAHSELRAKGIVWDQRFARVEQALGGTG